MLPGVASEIADPIFWFLREGTTLRMNEPSSSFQHVRLMTASRPFARHAQPNNLQYDSAEWEPAFLRQAREFPFFPLLPREASKRVPIFDKGTGTKLQGSDTAAWSRA